MTFYLNDATRETFRSGGIRGGYTMPGKAVYLPTAAYETLVECINYQYRDYKDPRTHASIVTSYQAQISALQFSLNSANVQCNEARVASAAAQSRFQESARELQTKTAQIATLTAQNAALLATQATLEQQLQDQAAVMQRAAANIAELQIALQSEQVTNGLLSTKNVQLEQSEEQLKSEVAELKLRLKVQKEDSEREIKLLSKAHKTEVADMFRQIKALLHAMNPATSSTEDF